MKQTEAILGDMRFIPLKGVVLILILILTTSRVHAQYALGATGQMMIPTAEMQETGTFMGSANFLPEEVTPNKFNYPTSCLVGSEMCIRDSLISLTILP